MTNPKNKPIRSLQFGDLEATIWKNVTARAGVVYYTVTFTRRYRDSVGTLKAVSSFRRGELLPLSMLVTNVNAELAAIESRDFDKMDAEARSEAKSA